MVHVYDYLKSKKITTEAAYPYTATKQTECNDTAITEAGVTTVSDYAYGRVFYSATL